MVKQNIMGSMGRGKLCISWQVGRKEKEEGAGFPCPF
jgi:hypothetical protein